MKSLDIQHNNRLDYCNYYHSYVTPLKPSDCWYVSSENKDKNNLSDLRAQQKFESNQINMCTKFGVDSSSRFSFFSVHLLTVTQISMLHIVGYEEILLLAESASV